MRCKKLLKLIKSILLFFDIDRLEIRRVPFWVWLTYDFHIRVWLLTTTILGPCVCFCGYSGIILALLFRNEDLLVILKHY
jgi:hypothetical protein